MMRRFDSRIVLVAVAACSLLGVFVTSAGEQPTPIQQGAAVETAALIEFEKLGLPSFVDRSVKTTPIPYSIRKLEGRRIQVRVYMRPSDQELGSNYLLGVPEVRRPVRHSSVRDMDATSSEKQHVRYTVPVLLRAGTTIEFNARRQRFPLLIEGTLKTEGDSIDLVSPYGFYLDDATFHEVEPRDGYQRLWVSWIC